MTWLTSCASTLRISDIIIVQSLIRRHAAQNEAAIMRHERDTAAATVLQARYRSHHATKTYQSVLRKIVAIQCFVRHFTAVRVLNELKEQRRILEAEMTTKIASAWRKYHCQCVYKRAVANVIISQSIVRRHAAIKELNLLKFERDTAAATVIETEMRAYLARKHYEQVRCSTILLQSLVRQMIAYNELEELREERIMLEEYCAMRIAAVWRSYYTRTGYIIVLKGMHVVWLYYAFTICRSHIFHILIHSRPKARATIHRCIPHAGPVEDLCCTRQLPRDENQYHQDPERGQNGTSN